jgi:hypothetical protein
MITKKKAGAKASVKAAPVRRHKPGPSARRKAREARAAALYTEPQRAAIAAASSAQNLSASISGNMSPTEILHQRMAAEARLLSAQADAQEIANRRERGNVQFVLSDDYDVDVAGPVVAKQRQISEETAMLEKAQDFTAELLAKLSDRLTGVLRPDVPTGGEPQGEALSDRSPLADWVRHRAEHQVRFNVTLVNLLHRLDIG